MIKKNTPMKKIHYIILLVAFSAISSFSYGQQQVMFTQYMFNGLALNPAYAGIHEGVSMSMLWREQWIGFDGAPSTQTVSIHSPINYRPISLGAVILRDQIGVTTQTGGYFSYAYRFKLSKKMRLSLGLQLSLQNYKSDFRGDALSSLDPTLTVGEVNETNQNIGTGIMWHSDRFYVGVSVPQLLNEEFDSSNPDSDSKVVQHYFASAGYVFKFGKGLVVKPNILIKTVKGTPPQFDLNLNVLLSEFLWLGLSYRSLDSYDALVQLQLTPQLQLGYAFDFATTTDLKRVNSGSHEIMLNYIIALPTTKILTPRYF